MRDKANQSKPDNRAARRQSAKLAAEARIAEERLAADKAAIDRSDQRRAKSQATREKIADLRAQLKAKGIPLPVRFEFAEVVDTVPLEESETVIQDCGRGLYLVRSKGAKHNNKVQQKHKKWTCSCKGWTSNRKKDCKHILFVLEFRREGAPYSTARRRPPTVIIYDDKELTEHTRRQHAYREWPTRCPQLFEDLCSTVEEPPPKNKNGEGTPPVPLKVALYALLTKVEFRLTYAELSAWLDKDSAVQRLGWYRQNPLSISKLHQLCGDKLLLPELKKMITATADTGRNIETTAIIDASGLPNSVAINYLNEKHGKQRKRKNGKYIKPHWAQGRDSNLISYFDLTLDYGVGSGDAPHLGRVLRKTLEVWTSLRRMLADDIYGNKGNSKKAEALGVQLFTREKVNEDRSTWGNQASEIAEMQHKHPDEFDEIMRSRSRGETPPARIKGRQPFQRLRRRTSDKTPVFPEKPPGDEALCDLPDDELDLILDMAADAVGIAQANEAHVMIVAANTREIIMLEHLHDHRMSLLAHTAFHAMRIVHEDELRAA